MPISPANPNFEKPYKNYLRVDIPKANVSIVGVITKVRGKIEALITWQETVTPLSEEQALAYSNGLIKVANWARANGAAFVGEYWVPGKVYENQAGLSVVRFMFHDDITRFVKVSRRALGFGMYAKKTFEVDGGAGDILTAMQAATTLQQVIRDGSMWR